MNKSIIILLIMVFLISGCIGTETKTINRTYIYNFSDSNYIHHTVTLILYSDKTFSLSDLNHWCNCSSTDSGNYTETEKSLSIKVLTDSMFTKNGSDLVDKDGNTWAGLT